MVGTVWHRNIAVSLGGKPARSDGSVDDWLAADLPAGDSGFGAFLAAIDAILMDRATYEAVRRHGDWPYPGEPAVVMTTRPLPPPIRRCGSAIGRRGRGRRRALRSGGTAACESWAAGRRSVR